MRKLSLTGITVTALGLNALLAFALEYLPFYGFREPTVPVSIYNALDHLIAEPLNTAPSFVRQTLCLSNPYRDNERPDGLYRRSCIVEMGKRPIEETTQASVGGGRLTSLRASGPFSGCLSRASFLAKFPTLENISEDPLTGPRTLAMGAHHGSKRTSIELTFFQGCLSGITIMFVH